MNSLMIERGGTSVGAMVAKFSRKFNNLCASEYSGVFGLTRLKSGAA